VFNTFIRGNDAIVMKIEYSPVFKRWFKTCQPHMETKIDATVKNLHAAKHRFHVATMGDGTEQEDSMCDTESVKSLRR
jgi:hypothetical protein